MGVLLALLALPGSLSAEDAAPCAPAVPIDSFQYRFGLAGGWMPESELAALIENPTVIHADAFPAGRNDPAATIVTAETHAVYPIQPDAMARLLKDDDSLASIVPDLKIHETICEYGPDMIKQHQRAEFRVLFFSFGTEYLMDVRHALGGPDEYGSYWGMYESLDGKLAYQYGSWYFRALEIDGRPHTYVRHYIITGLTTRVPGLRLIAQRNAGAHVVQMFDALFQESVRRYGTTVAAAGP